MAFFDRQKDLVRRAQPFRITGRVTELTGLTVVAESLSVPTGSMCRIEPELSLIHI